MSSLSKLMPFGRNGSKISCPGPNLRWALTSSLVAWLTQSPSSAGQLSNVALQCIAAQSRIGWYQFILGIWSSSWTEAQQQWLTRSRGRDTSTIWMSKVLRSIWDLIHSLWTNRKLHSEQKILEHSAVASRIRRLYALPRSSFPRAVAR